MTGTILHHLSLLYGERVADALAPRLEGLLDRYRGTSAPVRCAAQGLGLSEHDALLITYADQVREAGVPPLRALAEFADQHLRDVISGLHILPFYPWSSDDGFSVKDYFAVDPALGGWADIKRLGRSFDLMFDAVFNHVSVKSDWFQRFLADDPKYREFFITVEGQPDLSRVVRPRALPLLTEFQTATGPQRVWTTFSADQADLNYRNPEVLLAALEALLFYAAKGARFLRLDAIAFLWKDIGTPCLHRPQTHRVVQLMRAVLDEVAPHVLLVTETNVPHEDNLSYIGDGTNEAQLVYNFTLPPLVLHSLTTGNAERLTHWAQSLALPSDRATFLNFLASHDGIGLNPARGILSDAEIEVLVARTRAHGGLVSSKDNPDGSRSPYELNINYLDALSNPSAGEPVELAARKFLTAQAIMLSLRGLPGIYFHSLFGSRGDRTGAEASGIARRINRPKLTRDALRGTLADAESLGARVFAGLRKLLHVRRRHSAFHPCAGQEVLTSDRRVFSVMRGAPGEGERVLCLHNVSHEPVELALRGAAFAGDKPWFDLTGSQLCATTQHGTAAFSLSPYQALWAKAG